MTHADELRKIAGDWRYGQINESDMQEALWDLLTKMRYTERARGELARRHRSCCCQETLKVVESATMKEPEDEDARL